MELRADIQLKSVIKAMQDSIIPAVDPEHKMAVEQANMVVHVLNVVQSKLAMQYRYDRHELNQYLKLSGTLSQSVVGGKTTARAVEELTSIIPSGLDVYDRARAEPSELVDVLLKLRHGVGEIVAAVNIDGSQDSKKIVSKNIMSSAKEQLARERSWLIPMGFEPDVSLLTPVEELIDEVN